MFLQLLLGLCTDGSSAAELGLQEKIAIAIDPLVTIILLVKIVVAIRII
jgi:hypothetical protein